MNATTAAINTDAEAVQVYLGSKFLDRSNPGWDRKIDLGTLDMANPDRCVLCQVYGSYLSGLAMTRTHKSTRSIMSSLGIKTIGSWDESAYEFGFGTEDYNQYPALTAAWTRLILARRAVQAPTA